MISEGLLRLRDGRQIGYTTWGDAEAPAVFYCHGFPTNRRELDLLQPQLERHDLKARVVALDRPGYGSSTFQANRTLLDWPSDVEQVAEHFGIERFAVIGVSGGSPYALACALTLGHRITRVGVVAGVGPIEATGMRQASAFSGPSANALIRRLQFEAAALSFRKGQEQRFVDKSIDTMSQVDQEALSRAGTRNWFTETLRASFSSGGRSMSLEAGLYRKSWGFDPGDIEVEAQLWHGQADGTVPPSVGGWLAGRIPDSNLVKWPLHGHFTWMVSHQAAEVFESLVG